MSTPSPYIRNFRIQTRYFPSLDSTNDEARRLLDKGLAPHGTVIRAGFQEKGRGQMGQSWQGNPGENLYISLVLELSLPAEKQFLLNMAVALSCLQSIRKYAPDALLKWPNDILLKGQKLGGILVENNISGSTISSSIVGIGINVNQNEFGPLTSASSLSLVAGREIALENFYEELCAQLEWQLSTLHEEGRIWKEYHENLLFFGRLTTFEHQGRLLRGKVAGVDPWGRLKVEEENRTHLFGIKEIRWLEI